LQAMSDTVLAAINDWLAKNPDATPEVKARLDLGYLTYNVLLLALCCDLAFIMFRNLIYSFFPRVFWILCTTYC
jgi:hypothetical protein